MILGVKKESKKGQKMRKKGEKWVKICFINNFFSLIYRHIVKKVKKICDTDCAYMKIVYFCAHV